ncbi:hypothetical protein VP01_3655g3, partial [Puccinia sorghi]
LNIEQLQRDVSKAVDYLTQTSSSSLVPDLDMAITNLTQTLQSSHNSQGSSKWRGNHRSNSWWDPDVLGSLVAAFNRARRWMLLSNTENTRRCYFAWQQGFKMKVDKLKLLHWRRYLARTGDRLAFQAFKFTKANQSSMVDPLYMEDMSLSSET